MSLENFPDLFLKISGADVRPDKIHSFRFKSFPTKRWRFVGEVKSVIDPPGNQEIFATHGGKWVP